MAFGIIDTTYVDLPVGIDSDYVRGLETRSGLSVATMIQMTDAAIAAINEGVDPLVAALCTPTSSPVGSIRGTSTKQVMRAGEYTLALPQQSSRVGHMLPIEKFELGMGFTEDGLEEITLDAFREELEDTVSSFQRFYLVQALRRLFSSAEVAVGEKTTVLSPGFAGSGSGTNVFTGVYPDGSALPGGYTHYAYTTPANLMAAISTYVGRLKKWHRGPYDMIASSAALADVITQAGSAFVPSGSALVQAGLGTAQALVNPDDYVGVLNGNIKVRQAVESIGSTKHLSIFKSYGAFAPGNPLAWRYDAQKPRGRDAYLVSRALYPMADAITQQWLGFGVNDRAAAVNIFIDTSPSAYVDPTIA